MTGGALSHVWERTATVVAKRTNAKNPDMCVGTVKEIAFPYHPIGGTTSRSATR
jgi:hypothetical protein